MTSNRNPLAEIFELLARKWALRIIWELREQPMSFRQLQQACGDISPTILNRRLKELKAYQIVRLDGEAGYQLTEIGRELIEIYEPIKTWSSKWQAVRNSGSS